jgi:hypothetical protein
MRFTAHCMHSPISEDINSLEAVNDFCGCASISEIAGSLRLGHALQRGKIKYSFPREALA